MIKKWRTPVHTVMVSNDWHKMLKNRSFMIVDHGQWLLVEWWLVMVDTGPCWLRKVGGSSWYLIVFHTESSSLWLNHRQTITLGLALNWIDPRQCLAPTSTKGHFHNWYTPLAWQIIILIDCLIISTRCGCDHQQAPLKGTHHPMSSAT